MGGAPNGVVVDDGRVVVPAGVFLLVAMDGGPPNVVPSGAGSLVVGCGPVLLVPTRAGGAPKVPPSDVATLPASHTVRTVAVGVISTLGSATVVAAGVAETLAAGTGSTPSLQQPTAAKVIVTTNKITRWDSMTRLPKKHYHRSKSGPPSPHLGCRSGNDFDHLA